MRRPELASGMRRPELAECQYQTVPATWEASVCDGACWYAPYLVGVMVYNRV